MYAAASENDMRQLLSAPSQAATVAHPDKASAPTTEGETASITGLNHLVLVTDDMEKTVRFWCDVLGLWIKATVGAGKRPPGALIETEGWNRLYFFEMGNGDTIAFVEFLGQDVTAERSYFDQIWPGNGRPIVRPQKMDHIALNVDSKEDLVSYQSLLRAEGYEVSEVQELEGSPFVKSIYLYDPNGIPLEISTWDVANPATVSRAPEAYLTDPDPVPALKT